MKISASQIKASELKAGDLYSIKGFEVLVDGPFTTHTITYLKFGMTSDVVEDLVYRITFESDKIAPQKEVVNPRGGFRFNRL